MAPKGYQALALALRQGPTRKALAMLQGLGGDRHRRPRGLARPGAGGQHLGFFNQNPAPAAAGFACGHVIWADEAVQVYQR
jgi:hypothetical protein